MNRLWLLGAILLGACAQNSDDDYTVRLPLCKKEKGADNRWVLVRLDMAGDTARPTLVCRSDVNP